MDDRKLMLVSVCCMAYNHEHYIKECLEGIMMQKTDFAFEVLIHDDASTDMTASIIREYESKYPDIIKPIYQTENQYSKGIQILTEFLYSRVNGKYIAFCEGDDCWIDPLKLQKEVDFLENNSDYGLVWTDVNCLHQKSQILEKRFFKNDQFAFCDSFEDYLLYVPFRAPCTWMYRKECAKSPHKSYVVGDLPLILDILADYKVKKMDDVTALYRVVDGSASHFKDEKELYAFMQDIYEIQMDYAKKYKVSEKLIDAININFCKNTCVLAAAAGDLDQIKITGNQLSGRNDFSLKLKLITILAKTRVGRFFLKARVKLYFFTKKWL
jgi:Glycosyltransferases involved in cell wall biogenesis